MLIIFALLSRIYKLPSPLNGLLALFPSEMNMVLLDLKLVSVCWFESDPFSLGSSSLIHLRLHYCYFKGLTTKCQHQLETYQITRPFPPSSLA